MVYIQTVEDETVESSVEESSGAGVVGLRARLAGTVTAGVASLIGGSKDEEKESGGGGAGSETATAQAEAVDAAVGCVTREAVDTAEEVVATQTMAEDTAVERTTQEALILLEFMMNNFKRRMTNCKWSWRCGASNGNCVDSKVGWG